MIVLDASVLIAHLDAGDDHHAQATKLLLGHADEGFAGSVVTIAEVLVRPAAEGRLDDARGALRDLELQPLALAHDSPARLARLRADTALKLPDCCVLLAAREAGARTILTFDHRLRATAERLRLAE